MDHMLKKIDALRGKWMATDPLTATCSDKFEHISESAKEHLRLLKR